MDFVVLFCNSSLIWYYRLNYYQPMVCQGLGSLGNHAKGFTMRRKHFSNIIKVFSVQGEPLGMIF